MVRLGIVCCVVALMMAGKRQSGDDGGDYSHSDRLVV